MNEVTLVEDISKPHNALARNNIPSFSPREERLDTTIEDSPTTGGYWDKRVKQSRVSSFSLSPDSSSNGSQEILKPVPNTRGRNSQRYHREQEAEREQELGRQRSIEETKLLQNHQNTGKTNGRSRARPQSAKK